MSQRYENEQAEITAKIKTLKAEIDKAGSQSVTTDMFLATIRKYTRAKKLTSTMLNELIQYIVVYPAEKIDGVWEQRLTIHYNCVGIIDIPAELSLPSPEVSMNTRKGVTLSYAPNAMSI